MFVKPKLDKTTKSVVRQNPDGMVKPKLVELQCPISNPTGQKWWLKSGFLHEIG